MDHIGRNRCIGNNLSLTKGMTMYKYWIYWQHRAAGIKLPKPKPAHSVVGWRMHTMLWFIQRWPYFEMAMELGVSTFYAAARFAANNGLLTHDVRRWIPTTTEIYSEDEKSEVQKDYDRMSKLFTLDVDNELQKLVHTTADIPNRGLDWGDYSQFERMLYEHHVLKNKGRGPQLMRLQLSNAPRIPWYKNVTSVAKRIATNLPMAKLYIDAFTELQVSSSLAYKLCKLAQDNPKPILNYLELAASELHILTLQPDEKEEIGFSFECKDSLNPLVLLNLKQLIEREA